MSKVAKNTGKVKPGAATDNRRTFVWIAAAAAAVVGLWAYSPALNGAFLFDDMILPYALPGAADGPWTQFVRGIRPLLYLMFWIEARTWTSPFGFHLVNLLLHLLNSVLMAWVCRQFLEKVGMEPSRLRWFAAFAGGLFLLHPLNTEAVAYIASRSEVLSVFFFLAAYGLYLRGRDPGVTAGRTLLILILFGAGVASKEHIIVFPALLVATEFFWAEEGFWSGIRRNWKLYLVFPLAGTVAVLSLWKILTSASTAGFGMKEMTWYQYFLTQCKALFIYLRLFVLPLGQNIDHAYPVVREFDALAILGGFTLVLGVVAAVLYRQRYPLLAFGFVAFLILIAPTSSFVPIADTLVERRVYLPEVGLLLMTLELLRRWKISREVLFSAMAGLLVVMGFLTHERAKAYENPIAMWQDVIRASPHNARAHFQLAFALYETGQCEAALKEYALVETLQAPDYRLLIDTALALDCVGRGAEAQKKAEAALKMEQSAQGWVVLAMIHAKQNQDDQALAALAKAEAADSQFDMTYVYRGNIHYNRGRFAEAASEYQKALARNARNADASKGLGLAIAAQQQRR